MKEIIKLNKELEMRSNISEVTSINLECLYDVIDSDIEGKFEINGSYKDILSDDNQEFKESIPFTYSFLFDVDDESIKVNVLDFDYTMNRDIIELSIQYEVIFEKISREVEEIEAIQEEIENVIEEPIIEERNEINNMVEKSDEKYITYKIHVCELNETIESIAIKYNVSVEDIKSINNIDEVNMGYKIIIPIDE